MPQRNLQGKCPYCTNSQLVDEAEQPDPRRVYQKCTNCDNYSAKNLSTGYQYPLADSKDVASAVVVRTP